MKIALGIILALSLHSVAQQVTPPNTGLVPPAMESARTMIDPLSIQSLLVQILFKGKPLGTGTGFVVEKNSKFYLVTNWHVVTDHRPDTGASLNSEGVYPDEIRILHNKKGHLGSWVWKSEKLIDDGNRYLWIEHPKGRAVDIVFLPLSNLDDVQFYPVDLSTQNISIATPPSSSVVVVGFPFGYSQTAGLSIWKTGAVASDTDIDYDGAPQFLVDCTARPGMSGSPVYARRTEGYTDREGTTHLASGVVNRFMGIFAGDIADNTEIGRVWKASAIETIYDSLN